MANPKKDDDYKALADPAKAREYLQAQGQGMPDEDAAAVEAAQAFYVTAADAAAKAAVQAAADAKAQAATPTGMALMRHNGGATSTSFDGVVYEANGEGLFTVPLGAIEALTPHGFELVGGA